MEPEAVPAPTLLVEYPPIEPVEPPPAARRFARGGYLAGAGYRGDGRSAGGSAYRPLGIPTGGQRRRPAADCAARPTCNAIRQPVARRHQARAGVRDAGAGQAAQRRQPGPPRRSLFAGPHQSAGRPARASQLLDNVIKGNAGSPPIKQFAVESAGADRRAPARRPRRAAEGRGRRAEAGGAAADGAQTACATARAWRWRGRRWRRRRWRRRRRWGWWRRWRLDEDSATFCWSTTIPTCSS